MHLPDSGEPGVEPELEPQPTLKEDIEFEKPTTVEAGDLEPEPDFIPPKIDLTGIIPEASSKPAQPHQREILESKHRGQGVSFEFKKPKKKLPE